MSDLSSMSYMTLDKFLNCSSVLHTTHFLSMYWPGEEIAWVKWVLFMELILYLFQILYYTLANHLIMYIAKVRERMWNSKDPLYLSVSLLMHYILYIYTKLPFIYIYFFLFINTGIAMVYNLFLFIFFFKLYTSLLRAHVKLFLQSNGWASPPRDICLESRAPWSWESFLFCFSCLFHNLYLGKICIQFTIHLILLFTKQYWKWNKLYSPHIVNPQSE